MLPLLRQVLGVLVSRGILKGATFVSLLVLARGLGADGFGLFGVFSSTVFIVAAAGNLGLRQASAYRIGRGDLGDGAALAASLLLWPAATAVSTTAICLSVGTTSQVSTAHLIALSSLSASGAILVSLAQGVFLGRGDIRRFNISETTPRLVLLVGVVALYLAHSITLVGALYVFSLGFLAASAFGLLLATPREGGLSIRTGVRSLGSLTSVGWPYALALTFLMLNDRVSVFMLANLVSTGLAGQYFAALRLNELFLETASAIGLVLFSHSTRCADPLTALRHAAAIARWLTWGIALIAVFGFGLIPWVLPILLGNQYQDTIPAMQVLIFGLPFAALNKLLYPVLAGLGRPLAGVVAYGCALVLNTVISYYLISVAQAVGGAIALVGVQMLISTVLVLYAARRFNVSPGDFLIPKYRELTVLQGSARALKVSLRNWGRS